MTAIFRRAALLTAIQKHGGIVSCNQPAHIHVCQNSLALFRLEIVVLLQAVKRDIAGIKFVSGRAEHRRPLRNIVGKLPIARPCSHEARGLAKHGIVAVGIGQIIVKCQPQRSPRAGRTAIRRDALGIDMPRFGIVSDKLNGPRRIAQDMLDGRGGSEPIIDRRKRNALCQTRIDNRIFANALFIAIDEPAPVNINQNGCWRVRLCPPKIQHIAFMRAIRHILQRGQRLLYFLTAHTAHQRDQHNAQNPFSNAHTNDLLLFFSHTARPKSATECGI